MNNLLRKILGLIIIIVVYLGINGTMWVAQELYHKGDNKKLKIMDAELTTLKNKYTKYWDFLDDKKVELEKLYTQMEDWKSNGMADKYNSNIDVYNNRLKDYKLQCGIYDELFKQYDGKINEYNELNEESNSRWYLIPGVGRH